MSEDKKPVILALTGKGGVGKTSLSALIVRCLLEQKDHGKILAIDADPAVGLSTALGLEVASTVDDIRTSFIETVEQGETQTALDMLAEAKFRMVDALVEKGDLSFLAIGRPEGAGCYCKVNAYLKEIIARIGRHYDFIVIDGEAGIEQVNRRVMEKVTHLILVSDCSKKGLAVAHTVLEVADHLVMYQKAGLILNRIPDMKMLDQVDLGGISLLASIPDDPAMSMADMLGRTAFEIEEDTPVVQGVKQALRSLGLIGEDNV